MKLITFVIRKFVPIVARYNKLLFNIIILTLITGCSGSGKEEYYQAKWAEASRSNSVCELWVIKESNLNNALACRLEHYRKLYNLLGQYRFREAIKYLNLECSPRDNGMVCYNSLRGTGGRAPGQAQQYETAYVKAEQIVFMDNKPVEFQVNYTEFLRDLMTGGLTKVFDLSAKSSFEIAKEPSSGNR